MEPVVAAVVVALLVPLALYFHRGELRRRHAILVAVASKYRGYAVPSSLLSRPSLRVRVGRADIEAQMWTNRHGPFTGWSCRLDPPGAPVFSITTERTIGTFRKALGGQDVVLGNSPAFDRRFIVRTDDVPAVQRLFAGAIGERMLDWFPDGRLDCSGRKLELVIDRLPGSPADVEHGIELLAALFAADPFGLAALCALDGARYHAGVPDLPFVTIEGPDPIRIGPEHHGGRAITRARALGAFDGLLSIEVIAGEPAAGAQLDRLPPASLGTLCALGTADIGWSDGEVSVTWRTIETDRRHLAAAIAFLRELGRPSLGVFR